MFIIYILYIFFNNRWLIVIACFARSDTCIKASSTHFSEKLCFFLSVVTLNIKVSKKKIINTLFHINSQQVDISYKSDITYTLRSTHMFIRVHSCKTLKKLMTYCTNFTFLHVRIHVGLLNLSISSRWKKGNLRDISFFIMCCNV